MDKKLRLLLIDSSIDGMRQVLDKLLAGGYELEYWLASSPETTKTSLSEHTPDIILCNYDTSGLAALKLIQPEGQEIPFLFLAPNFKEKNIIEAMGAGADDCIAKNNLDRLIPAIEHNLREARIRQAHREAQAALQENRARLSAFISNLPGMACQILLKTDGNIIFSYVSEGSRALLELSPHELEKDATLFLRMIHPEDIASYNLSFEHAMSHPSLWNWEGRITMNSAGETKWVNLRCSPRLLSNGGVQWEGVMLNITQSKSTEIELNRSREELRSLSLHVQDVREQERLNISREVHDNLGGILTAIKLELVRMNHHLTAQNPKSQEVLKGIEELVDKCIVAASDISRTLRPGVLDCFGIVAAIEMEIKEFQKRTGIHCDFSDVDEGEELNPELDIALFRIFQETLTNIAKHAHASHIKVDIRNQKQGVALTVTDNGRGLVETDRHKPNSFGLRGIRERVMYLGGELKIDSAPNKGTAIAVAIPRPPTSAVDEATLVSLAEQRLKND